MRVPAARPLAAVLLSLLLAGPRPAAAETNQLYADLGEDDRALASQAVQEALEGLPSQATRSWRNAASGASGSVTPLRTFKIHSGHWCREYQEAVTTPRSATALLFTACRGDAGRWIAVEGGG